MSDVVIPQDYDIAVVEDVQTEVIEVSPTEIVVIYNGGRGSPGGGAGSDDWINFCDPVFGGAPTPGFDNTDAMNDAVAYAESVGAPGIKTGWVLPGLEFELYGRPDLSTVDLRGINQSASIFKCMTAGAGIDFTALGSVGAGVYAGESGWFKIDANNLATQPMVVGRRVSSSFSNILVLNPENDLGSDAVGLSLYTTQNCKFDDVVVIGGRVCVRFDLGAGNNAFYKCEIAGPSWTHVEFRATAASPVGHFNYTLYNSFQDTIFEGTTPDTKFVVHSEAGALNAFLHCPFSVNGSIIGGYLPTDMDYGVYCETSESAQSSVIIEDCLFTGNFACTVAYGVAAGSGRIQFRGGSIGAVDHAFQGNIVLESPPWYFSTVTNHVLYGGNVFTDPRREQGTPTLHRADTSARMVEYIYVPGEAVARVIRYANGRVDVSNGTATQAVWGLLGTLAYGISGNTGLVPGRGTTAQRPTASGATTIGMTYFDTDLGYLISYDGAQWVDGVGTPV